MFFKILAVLTLFCAFAAAVEYRLSTDVLPDAYNITIKPYLQPEDGAKRFKFDGEVAITLHAIVANVREITLHKDYIEISSVQLKDATDRLVEDVNVNNLRYESVTDKLTVPLTTALTVNTKYTLNFKYEGQIREGMAGFYRANYTDADGSVKEFALTQLQRIDARTAFPCFDEPAFKAKFRMQINRSKYYSALFNTRLLSTQAAGADRYMDYFEETPLMSTYLVAFIVSEYEFRGRSDYGMAVRSEYSTKSQFSYDVGQKALRAYDDYTKLPYKQLGNDIMQLASSPKFPHNGMENWGLVIYKDDVLVHEPGYTDGWANKQYTITIIVHETAHMWFGNSVTFSWWSYFWLNEAFARYYQYFMAHQIFPQYQLDQQFVINQLHLIFGTDAQIGTQPMTSPESQIQTPAEIGSKFSSIAYAKGASIIRMIRNLMEPSKFDMAIREYLKDKHLKNVKPADLFEYLKKYWPGSPKVDLDQFFSDWTEQVGFPMLKVTVSDDRRGVHLSQERFLLNAQDGSDKNLKYTIPITYTVDEEKDFDKLTARFYLEKSATGHDLSFDSPFKWIIFNLQQSNYYRVFYDVTTLQNIGEALMARGHNGIPIINRAQLIDDIFNFGRIGLLDYEVIFQFLEYLKHETEYLPWYAAFNGFERLTQRFNVTLQKDFGKFLKDISSDVFELLKFSRVDDTILDVYNRNKVIAWLCRYKDDDCKKGAEKAFLTDVSSPTKTSPDFRETLYCAANRFEPKNYANLEKFYKFATLPSEKELLLRAMGCAYHQNMLEYHYFRILTTEIPQEYKVLALKPAYKENFDNITPLFQMIIHTVERLSEALGSVSTTADVISDMANYFTNEEQQKLLDDLIVNKGTFFGDSKQKLEKASQTVRDNLQWSRSNLETLTKYLASRNGAIMHGLTSTLIAIVAVFYALF